MRLALLITSLAVCALAQENGPPGLLRGELLSSSNASFTFHAASNRTFWCSYDDKTYIERDNQRISMAGASKGDQLEVVSDSKLGSTLCYARTVHILDVPRTYLVPGARPRPRPISKSSGLRRAPGELTFSGVVLQITADRLTLRSRSGDRSTIHLRPDTVFSADGQMVDTGGLPVNTPVFVRAGKNLDGEVEAYQVSWGGILQPEE